MRTDTANAAGRATPKHPSWHQRLQPFTVPALALIVWQIVSSVGILNPLFFPRPTTLAATAVDMILRGDLGASVGATLWRAGMAFLAGAAAGIACGTAMGISTVVRRSLESMVSSLYSLPKLTLLPMLMLLVGVGETARLIVIATACFIQVALNTLDGIRGVDRHFVEMASNAGASAWQRFRRVYLPASLPQIFTGIRLAGGRAVITSISVEMISAQNGIGSLIWNSWQTFSTERLYVAVLTAGVLGWAMHHALRSLERRLSPWRI